MEAELRERRDNVRQTIDERANELREGGMHPFQVQNMRSAAGQELARAVPDTEKYQQAVSLATQYVQKQAA
jgi:gamma-glutamyl:cysteine ligase YbdK (ATP-grasp superfamily)